MTLGSRSTCEAVVQECKQGAQELKGKSAIVTGSSAGIGEECAYQLAKIGVHVVMAVRNTAKGQACADKMKERFANEQGEQETKELSLQIVRLDTSDLKSVKECLSELENIQKDIPPIQLVVANAGIYPSKAASSPQNHELTFATNHLGHFGLIQGLLPKLRENKARVVIVSSDSHYGPLGLSKKALSDPDALRKALVTTPKSMGITTSAKYYGDSKLCNVLFAQELASREKDSLDAVVSLHPGNMITTSIADEGGLIVRFVFKIASFFNKSVNQGTATTMVCALAPPSDVGGKYYSDCQPKKPNKLATKQAGELLWNLSEQLIQEHSAEQAKL